MTVENIVGGADVAQPLVVAALVDFARGEF